LEAERACSGTTKSTASNDNSVPDCIAEPYSATGFPEGWIMRTRYLMTAAFSLALSAPVSAAERKAEVVVYGATARGVIAAIINPARKKNRE
jgi:hypothetical protein